MLTYFFHVDNGIHELDNEGTELASMSEARDEAVALTAGILRDEGKEIWVGTPLRVWVTDEPAGAGQTFFTLSVSVS